jgi:hypothetical protein
VADKPSEVLLSIFEMIRLPLSFLTCTNWTRILQFRRTLLHNNTCCFSKHIYIYTYHLSFPAIWISQSDCSVLCFLSTEHSDRTIGQSDCFVISYAWTHLHLNFRASNNCVSCGFKNSSGIPNRKIESRTTKNARISKRFHFPQKLISLYTKVEASFL